MKSVDDLLNKLVLVVADVILWQSGRWRTAVLSLCLELVIMFIL